MESWGYGAHCSAQQQPSLVQPCRLVEFFYLNIDFSCRIPTIMYNIKLNEWMDSLHYKYCCGSFYTPMGSWCVLRQVLSKVSASVSERFIVYVPCKVWVVVYSNLHVVVLVKGPYGPAQLRMLSVLWVWLLFTTFCFFPSGIRPLKWRTSDE